MNDANHSQGQSFGKLAGYLLLGSMFGIILVKSEAVSWFRIQEMFRFQSVHMYGILGSGVAVAALSLFLLKRLDARDAAGEPLTIPDKAWGDGARKRYLLGGIVFGLGWGLAGACPGPMFALVGAGIPGAVVVLLSALLGTRVYAAAATRLPH